MTSNEAAHTLDNTSAKAHRRLTLIEEIFDGGTTARLARLGVAPGWRCLEVGAGAGSIARWLADRVGPEGSVTAVDIEPRFLLEDAHPNLEVVRQDVDADGVPGEGYDLIHARALLMHLPNREQLIQDLLFRLRPGGVVLLEECDCFPLLAPGEGALREVAARACEVAAAAGSDWSWGRHVPDRLVAAGAVEVEGVLAEVPLLTGGTLLGEFFALTVEQLAPLLIASGVSADLLAEAAMELDYTRRWHPWFALVAASGRWPY